MRDALIVIDGAEKKPLTFPDHIEIWTPKGVKQRVKIHTETRRIETGDYILASHPMVGCVERKNGPGELYDNLMTDDARRFSDCLARLALYKSPALYLEASLEQVGRPLWLTRPTRRSFPGDRILDALLRELAAARITLLTGTGATARGKLVGGTLVARYLIQAALAEENRP